MAAQTKPRRVDRQRRTTVRTCVGCRAALQQKEGVRLVVGPDDTVMADLAGKAFGRGAWVHPDAACIQRAARGGLSRSLRRAINVSAEAIEEAIVIAAGRRVQGLLVAARKSGRLVFGADATRDAAERGAVDVLVVACDAGRVAGESWVQKLVTEGRGVAWADKATLGQLLGRPEAAVIGVRGTGMQGAISSAAALVTSLGGAQSHAASVRLEAT